jgi:hypothetical protein
MFLVAAEFNFYSTRDHFVFGRDWQPTREDSRLGSKNCPFKCYRFVSWVKLTLRHCEVGSGNFKNLKCRVMDGFAWPFFELTCLVLTEIC